MIRKLAQPGLLFGILASLFWFSFRLSNQRIYQVDECQNLYMAKVLATNQASEFFTNASLFLLGPLSWMTKRAVQSAELFTCARLLFLGIFWVNVVLLALLAGGRLRSSGGLIALLAAATLAPMWDYGFEIRHDNLILTGVLLTWWTIRVRPAGAPSYMLAGAVAVTLLFIAVKALVYVLPLSAAILAFPPPGHRTSRWRLALAWVGGTLMATVLIRISYGTGGGWDLYLSVYRLFCHGVSKVSAGGGNSGGFGPSLALGRLLSQTPLLLALTAAACCAVAADFHRRGKAALNWEGNLPELLLFGGALGVLMINPTPYPYNLLHLVPYAFVLVFRYGITIWNDLWNRPTLRPLLPTLLIFTHFVPFGLATQRHSDFPNLHQRGRMRLAEDLTDRATDPVYDGVGMVPTRSAVDFQWYLHSLTIQNFINGPGPYVRDMLAARPAAVIIPNYRTDWLPAKDHKYIREHYVSLADDLWVLGKVLPAGGETFEIIHPGRYRISSLAGSDIVGSYPEGFAGLMTPEDEGCLVGTLDGLPLTSQPVELTAGIHRIECSAEIQAAVVWMGPRLNRVHRVPPGDHTMLFVNWY